MSRVRALLVAATCALVPLAARADSQKLQLDRVVAVVNDAVILQSELDTRMAPQIKQVLAIANQDERERRLAALTAEAIDEMIDEELIVEAAGSAKLDVDDKEAAAALHALEKRNRVDDKALAKSLAAQGYTLAGFQLDLKRQLLVLKAIEKFVAPPRTASAVRLSAIVIAPPAGRDAATAALLRVKDGEDFATVARDASTDAAAKASGGDLGWFEPGSVDPRWELVFGMEKGEVRGPIAGPKGLYVLEVTDERRAARDPDKELEDELATAQTRAWVANLRKQASIKLLTH